METNELKQWNVTATRVPTNYNDPRSYIVEALTADDAKHLVRARLNDFADMPNYWYDVKPHEHREVPGRIISG